MCSCLPAEAKVNLLLTFPSNLVSLNCLSQGSPALSQPLIKYPKLLSNGHSPLSRDQGRITF